MLNLRKKVITIVVKMNNDIEFLFININYYGYHMNKILMDLRKYALSNFISFDMFNCFKSCTIIVYSK